MFSAMQGETGLLFTGGLADSLKSETGKVREKSTGRDGKSEEGIAW
jgi:hypothetical protein